VPAGSRQQRTLLSPAKALDPRVEKGPRDMELGGVSPCGSRRLRQVLLLLLQGARRVLAALHDLELGFPASAGFAQTLAFNTVGVDPLLNFNQARGSRIGISTDSLGTERGFVVSIALRAQILLEPLDSRFRRVATG
jgi:hypothetical protein